MPTIDGLTRDETLEDLPRLDAAPWPRDHWRPADAGGSAGCLPHVGAREEAGVSESFLSLRFRGIALETKCPPAGVALSDNPSVRDQPAVAAAELDWLSPLRKIFWYPRDCHPTDLRVRPS